MAPAGVPALPAMQCNAYKAMPRSAVPCRAVLCRLYHGRLTVHLVSHSLHTCLLAWLAGRPAAEPPEMQVRLVNGTTSQQGRLEVKIGGRWGTVCSTGFTNTAAQLVCSKLGLLNGTAKLKAAYGQGKGPILMTNVKCSGKAKELSACAFSIGASKCTHAQDVGVACKRQRIEELYMPYGIWYSDGVEGYVVASLQTYGTVNICREGLTQKEARVICTERGLAGGQLLHAAGYMVGEERRESQLAKYEQVITGLTCKGSERSLNSCKYGIGGRCRTKRPVAVKCTRPGIEGVTLMNSTGSRTEGYVVASLQNQGRVTICRDYLGWEEARVICADLGLARGQLVDAPFNSKVAKYEQVITNLRCRGTEKRLNLCQYSIGGRCRGQRRLAVKCTEK